MSFDTDITDLLERKAIFHCSPCNGDSDSIAIEPTHVFDIPLVDVPEDFLVFLPSSLTDILRKHDGISLFYEDGPNGSESGLRIFSCREIALETARLQKWFSENLPSFEGNSEQANLGEWLEGLSPVAAPHCSGNLIVLDYGPADQVGEPAVYFLDHEYYFAHRCDLETAKFLAPDFRTFLLDFLSDPLPLLSRDWRHYDADQGQWCVEDVTFDRVAS